MSTEVTQQEPVLVLDDKKYVISELSDTARYIVTALSDLQGKIARHQIELDQWNFAKEGLTSRLKQEVEKEEPTEEVSE